jgi:hypothetical protein
VSGISFGRDQAEFATVFIQLPPIHEREQEDVIAIQLPGQTTVVEAESEVGSNLLNLAESLMRCSVKDWTLQRWRLNAVTKTVYAKPLDPCPYNGAAILFQP